MKNKRKESTGRGWRLWRFEETLAVGFVKSFKKSRRIGFLRLF